MNIDASLLQQAARAAAGDQQYPPGTLYVVATPIGNLADVSLRAIHVLASVDAVACEDTRVTAGLLRHLGVAPALLAVHEHNEAQAAAAVVARLAAGERVACVSDAGTPAVSDPGARLVAAVRAAGHRVVPVPGASSVIAALSAAGDMSAAGFRFHGFAPARGGERRDALRRLLDAGWTDVLFEAPHRIAALANELATLQPTRTLTVCRELTKQFESIATMPAGELPAWLAANANRQRGEFVLVLHATAPDDDAGVVPAAIDRALEELLAAMPLKQAVALAAGLSGLPRNPLYQRALALRRAADDADAAPPD